MASITGEQMDVLDRLWDIFESVSIKWHVLADRAGFDATQDAKDHYDDIGRFKSSKIAITRRDLKTVMELADILYDVKIDWGRVALRSGLRDEGIAKSHHHDLGMLESAPFTPIRRRRGRPPKGPFPFPAPRLLARTDDPFS